MIPLCDTFVWYICVMNVCDTLVGYICVKSLFDTLEDTLVGYICVINLCDRYIFVIHLFVTFMWFIRVIICVIHLCAWHLFDTFIWYTCDINIPAVRCRSCYKLDPSQRRQHKLPTETMRSDGRRGWKERWGPRNPHRRTEEYLGCCPTPPAWR